MDPPKSPLDSQQVPPSPQLSVNFWSTFLQLFHQSHQSSNNFGEIPTTFPTISPTFQHRFHKSPQVPNKSPTDPPSSTPRYPNLPPTPGTPQSRDVSNGQVGTLPTHTSINKHQLPKVGVEKTTFLLRCCCQHNNISTKKWFCRSVILDLRLL